jgi:hypothetical protein
MLSGSPPQGTTWNASRSVIPGRPERRISDTQAEQRAAPHSNTAIWSAEQNVRRPSRGFVTTAVASLTSAGSPVIARSVSTKNAGAKIAS